MDDSRFGDVDAAWLASLATSVEANPHHPPAEKAVARLREIAARLELIAETDGLLSEHVVAESKSSREG